jgi:membrane protein implicated in regulation of membrane protease activity
MGNASAWIMDVIGPAVLLVVLIWLVIRVRSNRDSRTEAGTRSVYREEEQRRREGTDDL